MKKYLIVILSFISILLVSCGIDDSFSAKLEFSLDAGASWQTTGGRLSEFDIYYEEPGDSDYRTLSFFAKTHDELLLEIRKAKDVDDVYDYTPSEDYFDYLTIRYNQDYFNEYVLLFYYRYESYSSENYAYDVSVSGSNLTLNINRLNGKSGSPGKWFQEVSIKKSDAAKIKTVNVKVRTVAPLLDSITVTISNSFVEDVYLSGLTKKDFNGLDNLKDVAIYQSPLVVDIRFNRVLNSDLLAQVASVFDESEHVVAIEFQSVTFLRVQVSETYLDEVLNNTLKITDLVPIEVWDSSYYTIESRTKSIVVVATLYLEVPGKENGEKMISQLKQLNLPFINPMSLY